MWRSVVVLLFIALVAESHSKIHPLSVHKTITDNLNVKRQTPEQDGCVEAKVNQTLPGSKCEAHVNCIEIALKLKKPKMTKDFLNLAFQVYCKPECGNLFLEAYEECGVLDNVPGFWEFFIGICSNNQCKEPHVIRTFTQPSTLPSIQHFATSITSKRRCASVKMS